MIIRQGDLMMRRVGSVSASRRAATVTLAVGEESGHSHVVDGWLDRPLTADKPGLVSVGQTQLRVAGMPWRHGAIIVPSGQYEFWIQRELTENEELEEVRRVQD